MSPKSIHKKRCIIQKLDFENCVLTNFKTTTRGRKKLRARISREIEHVPDIPQEEKPLSCCPVSAQEAPEPTSPVLIKRPHNRESPVFFKRKKHTPKKTVEELPEDLTIEQIPSSPSSPVFKSFKKQKRDNDLSEASQEFHGGLERKTSADLFNCQGNSNSSLQSSYQIEDFTQESERSFKISSVESTEVKSDNQCVYSIDANSFVPSQNPSQQSSKFMYEKFQSPKPYRRNYKKNSLLGRLQKLHQKQASEKLLWQHQNRKKSSTSLKVSINSFWKGDFNYFIKCQSVLSESELMFLIVDSRWVPNIKKVQEGSVLQIHPPWQKLTMEGSAIAVLLNLICLDILDETKEPFVRKRTTDLVPSSIFEADVKLFLDSLFSSCVPGLFC